MATRQAIITEIDSKITSNGERGITGQRLNSISRLMAESMHCHDTDGIPPKYNTIRNAGRFYCYSDRRWVTNADDNYGPAYYQFAESAGTGVDPIVEWEHMGDLVPAGTVIENLIILASATALDITDFEYCIYATRPDSTDRWRTGIDNDSEDIHDLIFRDNWWSPSTEGHLPFEGAMNDDHLRVIQLGVTLPEICKIAMYVKPIGTNTATRHIPATWIYQTR